MTIKFQQFLNLKQEDYDEDEPHEVRADEFQHAPKPVMEDEFIPDPRAEKSLGSKDISTFLSIIYIINQIYGPGVLAIPIVFQQVRLKEKKKTKQNNKYI